MKKGFTLIELLAVIIILAIIALIATPIILNIIVDARKSAGLSESEIIMSGINNYCATSKVKNQLDGSLDICADGITTDEISKMVNLGNAKVLEVIYNEKLLWLKIDSNDNIYSLVNGKMELGEVESPKLLIDLLLEKYSEDATTGLLKDISNSDLYYYKGTNDEVTNNYLWYGGHHWRIMEIDSFNRTLTLISQQPLTAIQSSYTIWNDENGYNNSYLNKWLNEYFYSSLDNDIKNTIINNEFNVGLYNDVDKITTIKKVGLLDYDQYSKAGGQNSYLDIKNTYWLGNINSTGVAYIFSDGSLQTSLIDSTAIRPVIKISDIAIFDGDGTLTSSYKTDYQSISTNDIQVGEYINVPYSGTDNACGTDNKCTFRVVSKDSDSIKVTLNGLLPVLVPFGDNEIISSNHSVYETLNTFTNNISSSYRYTGNKIFYIGSYNKSSNPQVGTDYNVIKNETFESNFGLPTVSEIFSNNDINMDPNDKKLFVDVNTIENPTVSNYYWTMNPVENKVNAVAYTGYMGGGLVNSEDVGTRPVIFLKNNLNFTSGNGTAQNPYELN